MKHLSRVYSLIKKRDRLIEKIDALDWQINYIEVYDRDTEIELTTRTNKLRQLEAKIARTMAKCVTEYNGDRNGNSV